jgi:hypothetical protein
MNRIQFWVLLSLASLIFIFLVAQAGLSVWSQRLQVRAFGVQQQIQEGRACDQRWRQLVTRIVEVNQKAQDQGLKDVLTRQGITVRAAPSDSSAPASPPPSAPAPTLSNP